MVAAVLSLLRPARPAAAAMEPAACHRLRRAATGCHNRPLLYTPGVAPRRLARPRGCASLYRGGVEWGARADEGARGGVGHAAGGDRPALAAGSGGDPER